MGSSINQGLISASLFTYSIACGTPHARFASIISTFPLARVRSFDAAQARGFPSLGQVSGVDNDGACDLPAVEVRRDVGADLHLEVVEALMMRLAR